MYNSNLFLRIRNEQITYLIVIALYCHKKCVICTLLYTEVLKYHLTIKLKCQIEDSIRAVAGEGAGGQLPPFQCLQVLISEVLLI